MGLTRRRRAHGGGEQEVAPPRGFHTEERDMKRSEQVKNARAVLVRVRVRCRHCGAPPRMADPSEPECCEARRAEVGRIRLRVALGLAEAALSQVEG